ncbi:MAG: LysR family transcriptional regulator [Janthinobacterium lividum]
MAIRHMRVWRYVDAVARAGSFRKAAEALNVTATALQRRVQDLEADFGAELFERLPTGVRPTAAGEALIRWVRSQAADLERVQSHIEDLSGLRRGVVRIACSQALAQSFLPEQIATFTTAFPQVQFQVVISDHGGVLTALRDYEVDLGLVFNPERHADFQPLMALGQRLVAIMAADHPLAGRPKLRLRDIAAYPLALPDPSFSGRQIVDMIMSTSSVRLDIQLEANSFELLRNYTRLTRAVTVQIEIGADASRLGAGLVARPIDDRDLAHGSLVLGQLRNRSLPVAVAKFADQIARELDARRSLPTLDRS